jgi:sugar lactone lactonase YvrE
VYSPTDDTTYAALARVNSNGTLDGSFGGGGEVIAPLGQSESQANGLALQPDGKLVAPAISHATNSGQAVCWR